MCPGLDVDREQSSNAVFSFLVDILDKCSANIITLMN